MQVVDLRLAGTRLIKPIVHRDERGIFVETYRFERYREIGIDTEFVQDNRSVSHRGVVRGLHYQTGLQQAKLVTAIRGKVFEVVVDISPESPQFGQWLGVQLDGDYCEQLYVPAGKAHGFCVLSDEAELLYKVSTPYDPLAERTLSWDDPEVGIVWPVKRPLLSERDRRGEPLAALRQRER